MKHVLVVEDEKFTRTVLSIILKKNGYLVTEAENGLDALKAIEANRNDGSSPICVVLTDIQMPVMSGIELIEELHERNVDIPVLILTGHDEEEMMDQFRTRGFPHFLNKPFEPEDVIGKLTAILGPAAADADIRVP